MGDDKSNVEVADMNAIRMSLRILRTEWITNWNHQNSENWRYWEKIINMVVMYTNYAVRKTAKTKIWNANQQKLGVKAYPN